jgi:glycosyltransferase involved in cell wall biosynthesis
VILAATHATDVSSAASEDVGGDAPRLSILAVASLFAPHVGGTETFLSRVLPLLRAGGHDVTTLGCRHLQSRADLSVPTVFLGPEWPLPRGGLRLLRDAVTAADLVLINNSRQPLALIAALAAGKAGKSAVLFPHCVETDLFAVKGQVGPGTRAYFAVARLYDRYVVPLMLKHCRVAVLSRREEKVVRSTWGVPATFLRYPVAAQPSASASPRLTGPLRLLWAARFVHQKAPAIALAAATQASARMEVELHFYGDGPLRRETEARAARLPWVHFHGSVNQDVLRAAQSDGAVVFSSSLAEGAQLAILEPLCSGTPVIATAVGDAPDYYPDTLAWACVPPGDSAALAGAIERFAMRRAESYAAFAAGGEHLAKRHGAAAKAAIVNYLIDEAGRGRRAVPGGPHH